MAQVAVKVPNVMQTANVEAVMKDLKREIETMAQLKHENVVNLLGVTAGESLRASSSGSLV